MEQEAPDGPINNSREFCALHSSRSSPSPWQLSFRWTGNAMPSLELVTLPLPFFVEAGAGNNTSNGVDASCSSA